MTSALQREVRDRPPDEAAAAVLAERAPGFAPRLGLVLGSGLGTVADAIEPVAVVPYGDLPGFPASAVAGHAGRLVLGDLAGLPVTCLQGRAHPYEGHPPAALRAPDGSIHAGANVENAAYPEGQCAEASAIGALVAAGHEALTEAAVVAEGDVAVPCGGCRQRLSEFAGAGVAVHLGDAEGLRRTVTLGELLPLAFRGDRLP